MNFFESQDAAKRNTGRLIILFGLAVISLIIVTNLVVLAVFGFVSTEMSGTGSLPALQFDWGVFLLVAALVSGVIFLGSLYKIHQLSGGGARVAEMMNGRLLVAGTPDLQEQRVLNVVEEMAIASGTPVPPVYLMEEAGINAFAAGYSPSDAVIGITRGAIDTLTRDQLQGVIAHEFSHILHGDMRINIRLIGVLNGILVLGLIGYHLMRGSMYSRRSKNSSGIVFLGLGLVVIGFVGTFFGNLIKAAVSRQREYLADASAVQFTRNPEGIAGALMQIATASSHSYLDNPNSAEISHALFEEGRATAFRALYATHPPIEQRIAAILPNWNGEYDLVRMDARPAQAASEPVSEPQARPSREQVLATVLAGSTAAGLSGAAIDQIGNPQQHHLALAEAMIREMPTILLEAARDPSGARAVIYLLVLAETDPVRRRQLGYIEELADQGVYAELRRLLQAGVEVGATQRLALVEIAIASLRQLSGKQYRLFRENFQALISLDQKISLLEWSLQRIVFHHLDVVFKLASVPALGRKKLARCAGSAAVFLSILAHASRQRGIEPQQAYEAGARMLELDAGLIALSEISFETLNAALDDLAGLQPLQKPALLKAAAATIAADGEVAPIEAELMRAVAATIDCPMPPLLD